MKYKVEAIGASFSQKDIKALSAKLSEQSDQGWEFHSVFSVEQTGCLGIGGGLTYLAVYKQKDYPKKHIGV